MLMKPDDAVPQCHGGQVAQMADVGVSSTHRWVTKCLNE